MARIYLPSTSAEDWRKLLAKPETHWRLGYSAQTLAYSWEAADGLPPEVAALFRPLGHEPELLIALPEHKVPLPGARKGESQNDIFALLRIGPETAAVAIEGKVDEPFDKPLGEWLIDASPGKRQRLTYLCESLGLDETALAMDVPYQLFHRTASAVIEAKRFKTDLAAMVVHSFSPTRRWFDAYQRFGRLFGVDLQPDEMARLPASEGPPLYLGWACGDPRFLTRG